MRPTFSLGPLRIPQRAGTVSGRLNQIAAANTKLTDAKLITGASPNFSANGAVISGAVILKIRPQLKIEAAVERRWGGYNSESHGPQTTLAERTTPYIHCNSFHPRYSPGEIRRGISRLGSCQDHCSRY